MTQQVHGILLVTYFTIKSALLCHKRETYEESEGHYFATWTALSVCKFYITESWNNILTDGLHKDIAINGDVSFKCSLICLSNAKI